MYDCHSSTTRAREEAAAAITGLEESGGIEHVYLEGINVLLIF